MSGNTSVQPRRISLVQVQPAPGVKPEVCNRGGAWLCPGPVSPPQDQADAFSTQVPDTCVTCVTVFCPIGRLPGDQIGAELLQDLVAKPQAVNGSHKLELGLF